MNSQAQLSAAQHLASGAGAGMPNLQSAGVGGGDDDDDDIPELEAVEEDGNVDETGVDPKDIELVIQQVGCSRAKAVRVLKESGGDLINASAYPHPSLSKRSILMSLCSHGRERVILLCCTVSLPHRPTTFKTYTGLCSLPQSSIVSEWCDHARNSSCASVSLSPST